MHRFTAENAREMAAKAIEARRRNQELRKLNPPQQPQVQPVKSPIEPDDYVAKRISRTRKQIEMIDRMIEGEIDPKAVEKLCAALARLSEIERVLSGRPAPGVLKPSSKPTKKQSSSAEPIE